MEEIKFIGGEKFLVDKITSTARIYKAKLHVSTGQFSFIEVEMEAESKEIIEVNNKLQDYYEKRLKAKF